MRRTLSPIAGTVSAASAAFLIVLAIHWSELTFAPRLLAFLLLGILYAQLFEYWYHAVPMHRGLPLLGDIKRNHLEHHHLFHGANFRTRDPAHSGQIPGRWWAFPILFFTHYGVLTPLLEAEAVVSFLFGAVTHYLAFEITHWFTHIEDNGFDRFVERIPFLRELRAHQIEHHRIHHETPIVAFNFNPPYLGDRLTGKLPRPAISLAPEPHEPIVAEPALVPVPTAPALVCPWPRRFRYGTAFALGTAAVIAVALLAHGRWSTLKPHPSPKELSI
jgi:hypothetical protein